MTEKKAKQEMLSESFSFRLAHIVSEYMDKYYLDPVIGLLFPGVGSGITSCFVVVFIYISLFKFRSIPLTLAIIYNVLVDVLVGMVPFYIGTFFDVFNKAYVRNARLIDGFAADNKVVVREVNRKAVWMAIMIVVVCFLIYLMIQLMVQMASWMDLAWEWIVGLFS